MVFSRSRFSLAISCLLAVAASASMGRGSQFVRLDYNLTMDDRSRNTVFIEVFDVDRPLTANNFMQYVNGGLYDGTLMHRLVSGFVLQGGGFYERRQPEPLPQNISLDPTFTVDLDGNPNTPNPTVNNEFDNQPLRSNLRGTLAMAKASGNPDSATNQFFFNLIDNDETSPFNNLDVDNGGFTVFAQVVGDGMILVDAFGSLNVVDLNPDTNDDGLPDGGPFGQIPFFENNLVRLERAHRIDYLGPGSATNVPSGGLIFNDRDAFIDTGAAFSGNGNIVVGEGRTLGIREGVALSRPLINRGTVAPGLQIGVANVPSYQQLGTGTLEIQLRGTNPPENPIDSYDQLFVVGQANLAGKLDIQLINQYMPKHDDEFEVLSAAAISGSFDTIDLPMLTAGLVWDVNATSAAIVLSVAAADFNKDGVADAADYTVWRDMQGRTGEDLAADANGDMKVDAADLAIWQSNFGNIRGNVSAGAGSATTVPEPGGVMALLAVIAVWCVRRSGR